MSLVSFRLSPLSLLNEVLRLVRPHRPSLPSRLLEDLQNLNSLDLYLKNQRLVHSSTIAATDLGNSRALSSQVLYGIRDSSPDTAAALCLWAGFLSMRTRSVRFAATKLLLDVLNEFVAMIEDPTSCSTDTEIIIEIVAELWQRFLADSYRDINSYQRVYVLKHVADWAVKCPNLFFAEEIVVMIGSCLEDTQESVRKEAIRQARKVILGTHTSAEGGRYLSWRKSLMVYAEHDAAGGSVNRRTAIELLDYMAAPGPAWCLAVLRDCIRVEEPPNSVAFAMRLIWNISKQNLAEVLLGLDLYNEASADLLGRTFLMFRPYHAWDELSHAMCVHSLSPRNARFLVSILVVLSQNVNTPRILRLVKEIMRERTAYNSYAALLLKHVSDKGSLYFALVDELVQLQINEVASVIEQWTENDLRNGGHYILNKPRATVYARFSGLVSGNSRYSLAAQAQNLIKRASSPAFGDALMNFIRNLPPRIDSDELEVVVSCLARLCAAFRLRSDDEMLQIDATVIFASLCDFSEPLSNSQERVLMNIMLLKSLGVLQVPEASIFERFPHSHAVNTEFVAGGAAV